MTKIIAEIGHNHNGDIALAKALIWVAKAVGADIAKFQVYDTATLPLSEEEVKGKRDFMEKYYRHTDYFKEEFDYLDTIDDLRRQVEKLEKKLYRPFIECEYCEDVGCTECPEESGRKQYL